jgi:hypothetical protein
MQNAAREPHAVLLSLQRGPLFDFRNMKEKDTKFE